jgi:hypothetical protein
MTTINYALTTKEKVKFYLNITDTSKDTLIDQTISGVSGYIQRYTGKNFLSQTYAEIRDSEGKSKLFLYNYPVTSLTSLEYRSGTPTSPVWNTFDANSYLLYSKAGYIGFYSILNKVMQGFKVNYTAGYLIDFANEFTATHTLPFEITQLATELVAQNVNTSNVSGISSESTEGQSVAFNMDTKSISSTQKAILNSYKVKRV